MDEFDSKKNMERDFAVGPLEGIWRADDKAVFFSRDKSAWGWTMMISQPGWVSKGMFQNAVEKCAVKRTLPALSHLRLTELTEGNAVQIMHIGPYDDEGPTLAKLHNEYLPTHELVPSTDHRPPRDLPQRPSSH